MIHVVTPGETLTGIAARYGVPLDRLIADNGLDPDEELVVGQTLVILFPEETYTVQEGDTLSGIAARYGTTVNALLRNNPQLGGESAITPGDTLVIRYMQEKQGTLSINGYAYPFIEPATLRRTLPYLTGLSIFSYGFEEDGTLIEPDDGWMLAAAREYGVMPILVLTTLSRGGSFRSELAGLLLTDDTVRENLIDNLLAVMQEKGYMGVDVDFEYIPSENAAAFADFVAELTARTNALGLITLVALAPKTSVDQPGLLYEAHNYAALGAAANYALLMTYEWGYTYGPPMAVAPLNNVRRVLEFGVTQIPPEKVLMGIPNYGYDWPLPYVMGETRARTISNAEAVNIARRERADIQFDPVAQAPYFNYTDDSGQAHVVWFEDARSIERKLALIPELGLRGASYWTVMRWFPQDWAVLNALYDLRQ